MKLEKHDHVYLDKLLHYRYFELNDKSNTWVGYEEWIYPKYNTHDRCYYNYGELVGFGIDDNIKYYNI